MKKILLYISVVVMMFSCIKDAEHHLQEKYPVSTQLMVTVNIDANGATFVGSIERQIKEPVIDHGFVWGSEQNPTLVNSHVSLGAFDTGNDFQTRITYDLKPNQTYYVRTYITTNDYVVYGEAVQFISLGSSPPIIERIEPSEITCYMDKITVYGKNFCSDKADAKIDNRRYYIESISPDSIVLRSNEINIGTNAFNLSIFDKTIPVTFEATGLVIESINPQPAEVGSVVTIKGRHLSNINNIVFPNASNIQFAFGTYIYSDIFVEIVEQNDTEVKIQIPVLKEGKSTLQIHDTKGFYSTLSIDILSPWKPADIPFDLPSNTEFCNYQDILYTLNNNTIYQLDMQNQTYQSITMIPEETFSYAIKKYFMIENNFYLCTESGLFHCYNVTTNTWEKLPSQTSPYGLIGYRDYPVLCFSIEGKIYMIAYLVPYYYVGFLFEYDPVIKIWEPIKNVDYIIAWHNYGFTCTAAIYNGKTYISSNNRIWEFDNQTHLFQEKNQSATGKYSYTYNNKIYIAGNNYLSHIYNANNYIAAGSSFIEYDPEINQIKQLPQLSYSNISLMYFWKNFLYAHVYTEGKYEYLVFDLSEL